MHQVISQKSHLGSAGRNAAGHGANTVHYALHASSVTSVTSVGWSRQRRQWCCVQFCISHDNEASFVMRLMWGPIRVAASESEIRSSNAPCLQLSDGSVTILRLRPTASPCALGFVIGPRMESTKHHIRGLLPARARPESEAEPPPFEGLVAAPSDSSRRIRMR